MKLFARHRIARLPILVLMPHGGCNCRCIMCDYWKGDRKKAMLSLSDLERQRDALRRLRVQWVLLSGGEALLHPEIWEIVEFLQELGVRITLLSNGLLLERFAEKISPAFDEVIVSLDGSPEVHDRIRGIPGLFAILERGIEALRRCDPAIAVSGRAVIQRANHRDLPGIVDAARELGLKQISFLPVDLGATAFERKKAPADLALDEEETRTLRQQLDELVRHHGKAFASGFIAEGPDKLERIARYFDAAGGRAPFVAPPCNAPWVSAVIEADGAVRPCFFHPPIGNLRDGELDAILDSTTAIAFRRKLEIRSDPTCRACVCPLYLPGEKLK